MANRYVAIIAPMSLTPQQFKALRLLGKGAKTGEVAAQLGITPRTIQRWQKDDEFASALKNISKQTTRLVVESTSFDLFKELEEATQSSVELLKDFIQNPDLRPSDRLKAIDIVRRWGDRHRFDAEIEKELNSILRKLERVMLPDNYHELLIGLSSLGHDELEVFAHLGNDDLPSLKKSPA